MNMKDDIHHDRQKQSFTLTLDGDTAVLDYRLYSAAGEPPAVDFTHTYVPPALRGRGLAEALVRHGLAWAKQEGYNIQASCWYVAKFLRSGETPSGIS